MANGHAGELLVEKDILYLPDFVVNAGGVTHTSSQIIGLSAAEVAKKVDQIPKRIRAILTKSEKEGITPHEAAERRARAIIAKHRRRRPTKRAS